jgi:hypothetical protein
MKNRWTIKELNGLDIFTFAMCILSERRATLNQEAPLAKKLKCAHDRLEELRDICRENENYADGLISAKEAIYRHAQHEYLLGDLETHMDDDSYESADCLEKYGLTREQVMADKELMSRIVELFHKHDGEQDHWSIMELAVTKGVKEVIERRREGKS